MCRTCRAIKSHHFYEGTLQVEIDQSDARPGEKAWGWVKKGVPIRLEVGAQELANKTVCMGRRDQAYNEKTSVNKDEFIANVTQILTAMQNNIFNKSKQFQQQNTVEIKSSAEMYEFFDPKNESSGGFAPRPLDR